MMKTREDIQQRFEVIYPFLNERLTRLWAAAEAMAIGYGGIAIVTRATGLLRRTIATGIRELQDPNRVDQESQRRKGAGRKKTVELDPTIKEDLEKLVEPLTRGEPDSPLRWTCKSIRNLADELQRMGHQASYWLVSELLHELGYSLQGNRKTLEGDSHPDRNAQFEHINEKTKAFQAEGQPVISVDAKKKELVGDFKNGGQELCPKGEPEKVQVHDFPIEDLGRATPYGVYDITQNKGWVNVGIDHDTAEFAVESIRRWWNTMGEETYPNATQLLITADAGGSNGYRLRQWKIELQKLADETKLEIAVCHLPPGTSKWNKIEHRLFSYITQNWRGKPLISYQVIVELIAATITRKGLRVQSQLDTNKYETGVKISDEELQAVDISRDDFHGEWNYTIRPHIQTS